MFSRAVFVALLLAGGVYVGLSAGALPASVASHFDASGRPNGSMSHDGYRLFMLLFVVGLPALVVTLMSRAFRGGQRLNLPHRDYWLAPPRRQASIDFLVAHAQWFGSALVLFLCLVHRLVLRANALQPPQLPGSMFVSTVVPMLLFMALWIAALMLRFGRPRPGA